jgi:hypothetical protein
MGRKPTSFGTRVIVQEGVRAVNGASLKNDKSSICGTVWRYSCSTPEEIPVIPVFIYHKPDRKLKSLAGNLARALPEIVAPALSFPYPLVRNGRVSPMDIMVLCREGSEADIHTEDLEIFVFAPDLELRRKNLNERKDDIIVGVRKFLVANKSNASAYVSVWLMPTASGGV